MSGEWPDLPWREWEPTISTLHQWIQIVGRVRQALTPALDHWWHVPLYVTARGLTTSPIPYGGREFQVDFDFVEHRLLVDDGDRGSFTMALKPRSVARFYREFMAGLGGRGIEVSIRPYPAEVADAVPFDQDERHASYDPVHAQLLWQALVQVDRVLKLFQTGFVGKASPVHLFWGSFDLTTTRFPGDLAHRDQGSGPNGPETATNQAESEENITVGWWPLIESPGPSFYAYAHPEPAGFRAATVRPAEAYFDDRFGEFLLPYDAVRTAADPGAVVLEFLQSTYELGADLGGWDRRALESV
jgi:Family of unknown function (DUF5996)